MYPKVLAFSVKSLDCQGSPRRNRCPLLKSSNIGRLYKVSLRSSNADCARKFERREFGLWYAVEACSPIRELHDKVSCLA